MGFTRTIQSFLAAIPLALALFFTPIAFATEAEYESPPADVNEQVKQAAQDKTAEVRQEVLEEATEAIRESWNALRALDNENPDEALASLERAAGKLEIILAREPELALAPASVSARTVDLLASKDDVKEMTDAAEDALEDGRVQEARRLIGELASELVISVSNIPLATYPDAIQVAAGLIDDGKLESAKVALQSALNTLVVTETIIPLPIVAAQQLLLKAEELAMKEDRSEEENQKMAAWMDAAQSEIEFAQVLGYGTRRDFENLYAELDELEEKLEGGKSSPGFFAKIKETLTDTVESSQPTKG